jgi:hypothetical protein
MRLERCEDRAMLTLPVLDIGISPTVDEAGSLYIEVAIYFSEPPTEQVSVDVNIDHVGGGPGNDDWPFASTNVTIAPWETGYYGGWWPIDDVLIEGDEDFIFSLSNPVNATIGGGSDQTTIIDNDFPSTVEIDVAALDEILGNQRVDEAEGFRVTGTVVDPTLPTLAEVVVKADLNFDGDTADSGEALPVTLIAHPQFDNTWTFSLDMGPVPDDGPSGPWSNETPFDGLTVLALLTDEDSNQSTSDSAPVTVYNISPQFNGEPEVSYTLDAQGFVETATVDGAFIDPGTLDRHKVSVLWGDGVAGTGAATWVLLPVGARTFSLERTFSPGTVAPDDLYPVVTALLDDDLGFVSTSLFALDITLHHGQDGAAVADDDELTVGAFTVANRNDTDGDAIPDLFDNEVAITTPELLGKPEVDLMKLVIKRPLLWLPQLPMKIIPSSVHMKFWTDSTKIYCLNPDGGDFNVWFGAGETQKVVWVELTNPSSAVRDYSVTAEATGFAPDTIKATAVWSEIFDYELTLRDAMAVFAEAPWNSIPETSAIYKLVEAHGGTGKRPISPDWGLKNVIIQAWKPLPEGILDEPQVTFDITRRIDTLGKTRYQAGNVEEEVLAQFPGDPDETNDDSHNLDEATYGGLMFVFDAPGRKGWSANPAWPWITVSIAQNVVKIAYRDNFEEFVRVRVDGTVPSGDGNIGSRASIKFLWHSHVQMERSGSDWIRSESYNEIEEEHDFTSPS